MRHFSIAVTLSVLLVEMRTICSLKLTPQEKLLVKFFDPSRRIKEVLPKGNIASEVPLIVSFKFMIGHIFDIKPDQQEVNLSLWFSMAWKNELVSWNQTEYPVKYLNVGVENIWLPTVLLYENTFQSPLWPPRDFSAAVYPDGLTSIDFSSEVNIRCDMTPCLYPVDVHHCALTFISLRNNASDVMILPFPTMDDIFSRYKKVSSGLWEVSIGNITPAITKGTILNGKGSSSLLFSKLTIKRKPRYFWVTVILPLLLLAAVTMVAPLFPLQTGERTTLLVTALLASVVYLDVVFKNVPRSSDQMPIVVYFILSMVLYTCFQIMMTALISYFDERSSQEVSIFGTISILARKLFHCRVDTAVLTSSQNATTESGLDAQQSQVTYSSRNATTKASGAKASENNIKEAREGAAQGGKEHVFEHESTSLGDERIFQNIPAAIAITNADDCDKKNEHALSYRNILEMVLCLASFSMITLNVILLSYIYIGKIGSFCSKVTV